jgi:hypothetical protein
LIEREIFVVEKPAKAVVFPFSFNSKLLNYSTSARELLSERTRPKSSGRGEIGISGEVAG